MDVEATKLSPLLSYRLLTAANVAGERNKTEGKISGVQRY
jgi:hypothetical protein